jgi:hypothetical protein
MFIKVMIMNLALYTYTPKLFLVAASSSGDLNYEETFQDFLSTRPTERKC